MTKLGIKLQEVIRQDKLEPKTYKIYDREIYNELFTKFINVDKNTDFDFGWFRINKTIYEFQVKKPRMYGSLKY